MQPDRPLETIIQTLSINDASQQFTQLIEAAIDGDIIFISTDDHQIVRLVPVNPIQTTRQFGSAKGLVHSSDDFNEPLEDFREY